MTLTLTPTLSQPRDVQQQHFLLTSGPCSPASTCRYSWQQASQGLHLFHAKYLSVFTETKCFSQNKNKKVPVFFTAASDNLHIFRHSERVVLPVIVKKEWGARSSKQARADDHCVVPFFDEPPG
jgi:hypothetical protein